MEIKQESTMTSRPSNQAQQQSTNNSTRGQKALFTLAYLVSFELKKLIQMPKVRECIDSMHL
jgi:hypothetical protein